MMMCRRRYRVCGGTCAGADIHLLAWRVFLFVYCYTTHHHIVTLGGTARLTDWDDNLRISIFCCWIKHPWAFFLDSWIWMDGWMEPPAACLVAASCVCNNNNSNNRISIFVVIVWFGSTTHNHPDKIRYNIPWWWQRRMLCMYIHILCLTKAPLLLAMRCDAMHSGHRLVRVRGTLNKQPACQPAAAESIGNAWQIRSSARFFTKPSTPIEMEMGSVRAGASSENIRTGSVCSYWFTAFRHHPIQTVYMPSKYDLNTKYECHDMGLQRVVCWDFCSGF